MKNVFFITSFVFFILSIGFYFVITSLRGLDKKYWGDQMSENGLWLTRENNNVVAFRTKETVKGYFTGYESSSDDSVLLNLRLVDDIDKTDFKVAIPRLYNVDNIKNTPEDIINRFTSKGSAVIEIVSPLSIKLVYMNSIYFPPTQ